MTSWATAIEHDGFQSGVQLNLTPVGARLFFGMPMSELTRRVVSWGVRFDALMRHLRASGAGTWAELAQRFGYDLTRRTS